jgi:hypothetical protein
MVVVYGERLYDGCCPAAVAEYGATGFCVCVHKQKIIDKINKKKLKLLQILHFFFLSLQVS